MRRTAALLYGVVCYAVFFGTFLYLVGFLADFGVPKSVDAPATGGSVATAVVVNALLVALFGLQHSVMARPGFKAWWTRVVPRPVERSTYVLATVVVLVALFAWWRPLPHAIWHVEHESLRVGLHALFVAGVGTVLYATFLIDHFDLFGLRQVFLYWRGDDYTHKRFATPGLYRHIRHPLYVGWFLTFWATPDMSVGHLLLAAGMTAYILAAIPFEERDLVAHLGDAYRHYRARTPRFVPRLRPYRPARTARAVAGPTAESR
jgi:protein-S-isoprenylcysteine O-methyltransferase Ste14